MMTVDRLQEIRNELDDKHLYFLADIGFELLQEVERLRELAQYPLVCVNVVDDPERWPIIPIIPHVNLLAFLKTCDTCGCQSSHSYVCIDCGAPMCPTCQDGHDICAACRLRDMQGDDDAHEIDS